MILRELITRFGFEVDNKNEQKFNKTVSGMTSKIKKIALLLGGTFSARQVFGLGLSVEQISEDFKRLAGTDFSKFNTAIKNAKDTLERERKGSSDILTDNKANALGSFFIKNVGKSQQNIQDFTQMLTTAAAAANLTKRSIGEVFAGLVSNRNNGGADALLGLGGFDKNRQGRVEYKMEILAGDQVLGGEFNRNIRGNILRKEIDSVLPIMFQNLRNLDDELFSVKRAQNTVADSVQKISSEATDKGVKFLESITEIPDKGLKGALFDLPEQKPVFKGGGVIRRDTNKPPSQGAGDLHSSTCQHIHNNENNITNNNTFNITADDPRKTGLIVEQKLREVFFDAKLEINRDEGR